MGGVRVASGHRMTPSRLPHAWLALLAALALVVLAPKVHASDAGRPAVTVVPAPPPGLVNDPTLDRATPRRTLKSFLAAARDGNFEAASHCLDLRGLMGPSTGPELAAQLSYVLYRRTPIDLTKVPDEPNADDGKVSVVSFTVGDQEVPLTLTRVRFDDHVERWVISRATVRRIPDIAAIAPSAPWEQKLPARLRTPVVFGNAPWQWLGIFASIFLAYAIGRLAAAIVTRVGGRFARGSTSFIDDLLVAAARRPMRTIFASLAFGALVYGLQVSLGVAKVLGHVAYTGFVLGFAWLLLAGFGMIARLISPIDAERNDVAPDGAGDRTRRALLQRVASAGVVGITVALLLLQFNVVRHVGLSLLASAGIAGVVLGLAAQKSLAGLIAGIQLSITQPIRLGDVVFLDGETGVVQDIFLTYAVVRYWDDRCLVVPLSRFIDQTFQNLTLHRHAMDAIVLLHVKFTAPVPLLRAKVREMCEANPKWDKRHCDLQVFDSDMYGMVLRATVSAKNPVESFDLKCLVREGLIAYLATIDGGAHLG
jgi:small-conductance mechanosensitive channel